MFGELKLSFDTRSVAIRGWAVLRVGSDFEKKNVAKRFLGAFFDSHSEIFCAIADLPAPAGP